MGGTACQRAFPFSQAPSILGWNSRSTSMSRPSPALPVLQHLGNTLLRKGPSTSRTSHESPLRPVVGPDHPRPGQPVSPTRPGKNWYPCGPDSTIPARGGFSLSASLSMKGTRNKLTSESRKSGGRPGKTLHCNMDRVPAGENLSAYRYYAEGQGRYTYDGQARIRRPVWTSGTRARAGVKSHWSAWGVIQGPLPL